jgi:hypothetical protein
VSTFNLLEWIETGTVTHRSVVDYNDRAVVADIEIVTRRLEVAEKVAQADDESLSDTDEVTALRAELDALRARWDASKTTWVVRALSDVEMAEIADRTPVEPLPDGTPEEQAEWIRRTEPQRLARQVAHIAAATVRVETARGTADGATEDQLRALRGRPHGADRIARLHAAVIDATRGEVEVAPGESPRPFGVTPD